MDISPASQYVHSSQAFPTAALADYVVNRDKRPRLQQKVSFLLEDTYKPDPAIEANQNYFGAPADDCVDLKAANFIIKKRFSLQIVDSE